MPKTHVKKRIKKQNTRKNNIKGGAAAAPGFFGRMRKLRPAKAIGALASKLSDRRDEKSFTKNITMENIKEIFNMENITPTQVPNYSSYNHYKINSPIYIFIDPGATDKIKCVHGIHLISQVIIYDNETKFILIKNDVPGHSAIFKSENFTCKAEEDTE
jgi:hypothetical protein